MSAALIDSFTQGVEALGSINQWSGNRDVERPLATYDAALEEIELIRRRVNDVLNATLTRIKKNRNWVPWLNRLPVEILCDVFRFAGGSGFNHATNRAIASTCTHWRTVALNDPHMWTCLDIDIWGPSCDYWALVLERNRKMALSIRIQVEDYNEPKVTMMLNDGGNLSRLRSLDISYVEKGPFTNFNAPHLEDLKIQVDGIGAPPLCYELPALRTLDLSGCYFPWLTGKYRNLTRIKIYYLSTGLPVVDPSWDFGVMFQESPSVESVELSLTGHSWCPFITAWHTRGSRLCMHSLKRLSLYMNLGAAVHILHSLDMPCLKKIYIATTFLRGSDASAIAALFSASCLPTSTFVDMRELVIAQAPGAAHLVGITTERESVGDRIMEWHEFYEMDGFPDDGIDIGIYLNYQNMTTYPTIRPILRFLENISMPSLNYTGVQHSHPPDVEFIVNEASWMTADIGSVLSFLLSHRTISSFTLGCCTPIFTEGFVNSLFRSINDRPLSGPDAFFPLLAHCRLVLRSIKWRQTPQFIPLLHALLSNDRLDVLLVEGTGHLATLPVGEGDELQLLQRTNASRMIISLY